MLETGDDGARFQKIFRAYGALMYHVAYRRLRRAAARSSEEFTAQLEEGYDPQHPHEFSPAFQSRMHRLMQRAAHPFAHRAFRRVAAVFLALLLVGSTWLATDVKARSAFIGWVTEVGEHSYLFRFEGNYAYEPAEYCLGYVPEGYGVSETDYNEQYGGSILCRNDTDFYLLFDYLFASEGSGTGLYSEADATKIPIEVNGMKGTYIQESDDTHSNVIFWFDEQGTMFTVMGFFVKDELLRMAESFNFGRDREAFEAGKHLCFPEELRGQDELYTLPEDTIRLRTFYNGECAIDYTAGVKVKWLPADMITRRLYSSFARYQVVGSTAFFEKFLDSLPEGGHWYRYSKGDGLCFEWILVTVDMNMYREMSTGASPS